MPLLLVLILSLILFAGFVFGVFYLMTRRKREMLYVCFGFVGIGFALYTAGYLSSGVGFADTLLAMLRGILSAARIFSIGSNDYGVVANEPGTQWLTGNVWVKILLWLSHLSALIVIQTALISLFGRKIVDNFLLRFGTHSEVYIIKGSDKHAVALGKNIATRDGSLKFPDRKRTVVFWIDEDDDEKKIAQKAARFGGIVQTLGNKSDLAPALKKVGLKGGGGTGRMYRVILISSDNAVADEVRGIVEYANELRFPGDKLNITVFTSSEWSRERIEVITQMKAEGKRAYPYTIHIVNETDLTIRRMIGMHSPFKCSGLVSYSGASRDFTVMIIGFGAVGQNAFLRLVMNGQFAGSRMRAVVVGKDIDNTRDCFMHRHPWLGICCDIRFENFDVQCESFFNLLNEVGDVDYAVIALDSDEMNKRTALDMRLYFERKGIALPFIAVSEKMGCLHKGGRDEKMFIAGCREEIYTEAVIIREEIDRMAMAVNDTYAKMYGGQSWHELDWFTQESNRASADFIPAMLAIVGAEADGVMGKDTLTDDPRLVEVLAETEHLRWNAFHAAMGYRPITVEEMRQRFEKYTGDKNTRAHLDYCRRDVPGRLHSCLVPWDGLDKVSETYCELARRAGVEKETARNFKENDRDIVKSIPKFLCAAKYLNFFEKERVICNM